MTTITFTRGRWRLRYWNAQDGVFGRYDRKDPKDTNYLRAELYTTRREFWEKPNLGSTKRWAPALDCEFTTLLSVDAPDGLLRACAVTLFAELEAADLAVTSPYTVMGQWYLRNRHPDW